MGFSKGILVSTASPIWFKNRNYIHFDPQIGVKKARRLVEEPISVANHSFYPFLHHQIVSKKLQRKGNGKFELTHKKRPILYAAHSDSQIYSYYAQLLSDEYEKVLKARDLSDCVLAFRSLGKSNIEFAHDAFMNIKKKGRCVAVALDASNFFDTLDHEYMKHAWCDLFNETSLPPDHYAVYKSLTKFAVCDRKQIYKKFDISPNNPWHERIRICDAKSFRQTVRGNGLIKINRNSCGIPQGSPISALLSNIYMLEFDSQMQALAKSCGGSYRRYCDDMLFIVNRGFETKIQSTVEFMLQDIKVSINVKKTEIRKFWRYGGIQKADKPLQYLGFTYDGQRILLRSAALAKFSGRMTKAIRLVSQTIESAKSSGKIVKLKKKKLYERYSHLGHKNFIRYGLKAANTMQSKAIKRQLKPLWNKLNNKMNEI